MNWPYNYFFLHRISEARNQAASYTERRKIIFHPCFLNRIWLCDKMGPFNAVNNIILYLKMKATLLFHFLISFFTLNDSNVLVAMPFYTGLTLSHLFWGSVNI